MLSIAIKSGSCVFEVKAQANEKFVVTAFMDESEEEHSMVGEARFVFPRLKGEYIKSASTLNCVTGLTTYVFAIYNSESPEALNRALFVHHKVEDNGLVSRFTASMSSDAFTTSTDSDSAEVPQDV